MTINEQQVDRLAQSIFRIETNFSILLKYLGTTEEQSNATVCAAGLRISAELEKLKALKCEMESQLSA